MFLRISFLLMLVTIIVFAPAGRFKVQTHLRTMDPDLATLNSRPHHPKPAPDGSLHHTAEAANQLGRSHWLKTFPVKSEMPLAMFLPVQSKDVKDLGVGNLLVANRNLADPNFAETVVLLIHYDSEGVVGLIVNRRTNVPISRVLEEPKAAKDLSDPIYLGGPVEAPTVFALLESPARLEGAEHIFGSVHMISKKDLFEKTISARPAPGFFHVYLGYAGWDTVQLRKEVELGAWFIFPADARTVFSSNPDSVWSQMIQKTELKLAGSEPPDADRRISADEHLISAVAEGRETKK